MTEDDIAWQLAAMEGEMDEGDPDQHMASQDEGGDEEEEEDEALEQRLRMLQQGAESSAGTAHPSASERQAHTRMEISPDNIQEREMAYLEMMRDRGVTPYDTWEKASAKIERDPRMYLIPERKVREALFESFCVIRAKELREAKEKEAKEKEEEERKEREKKGRDRQSSHQSSSHSTTTTTSSSSTKPEDIYRRLVEEYTTKTSTWLDFMTKYRVDPRFLGLKPGRERYQINLDHTLQTEIRISKGIKTEIGAEIEIRTGVEIGIEIETRTGVEIRTEGGIGKEIETRTETEIETGTETEIEAETEIGTEIEVGTGIEIGLLVY
ncbi:hypothetical protein BX616_003672, partial [Lobosporangium transversale]